MSRLIDADLLMRKCKCTGKFEDNFNCVTLSDLRRIIEEQPTAYDVENVVEQLKEELKLADDEKLRCIKENPMQFDEVKGYARGIAVAIEIIKRGGRDEE